jgi:hypothetical protein
MNGTRLCLSNSSTSCQQLQRFNFSDGAPAKCFISGSSAESAPRQRLSDSDRAHQQQQRRSVACQQHFSEVMLPMLHALVQFLILHASCSDNSHCSRVQHLQHSAASAASVPVLHHYQQQFYRFQLVTSIQLPELRQGSWRIFS